MDKFEQLYAEVVSAFVKAHVMTDAVKPDRRGSGKLFLDYNNKGGGFCEEFYGWLVQKGYLSESHYSPGSYVKIPFMGDSFDRNFAGLEVAMEVLKKFEGFEVKLEMWMTIEESKEI